MWLNKSEYKRKIYPGLSPVLDEERCFISGRKHMLRLHESSGARTLTYKKRILDSVYVHVHCTYTILFFSASSATTKNNTEYLAQNKDQGK